MPRRDQLPNAVIDALSGFRAITSLPVQWGDLDAFGHVNNVVYIRWLESSRVDLLEHYQTMVTMDQGGIGPILVSVHCDYKQQLHFPDTVHIGAKVGKIGRSSMTVEHCVVSEKSLSVAATGTSTLVVFDYDANRPVRVPDELRQALSADKSR